MLSLSVDMSGLDAYLQELLDSADGIAASVAQVIYEDWRSLAERRLKTSRQKYLEALKPPRAVATGFEVSLVGTFPVWVEEGKEPYDVGNMILKGREFVRVPFKQTPAPGRGKPAAFGASSSPMGYGYRSTPRGVDSRAGALASVQVGPGAPTRLARRVYGGGPATPPGAYSDWRRAGRRAEAGANLRKLYEHHSRPLYSGQESDAQPGVGGVTFRTVNQDSNWIHPGIQARRLADEVMRRFGSRNHGIIVTKHIEGLGGSNI